MKISKTWQPSACLATFPPKLPYEGYSIKRLPFFVMTSVGFGDADGKPHVVTPKNALLAQSKTDWSPPCSSVTLTKASVVVKALDGKHCAAPELQSHSHMTLNGAASFCCVDRKRTHGAR